MGNGDPTAVHTVLHNELVAAIAMPRVPREQLPVAALERAALGDLLATNRWLQPGCSGRWVSSNSKPARVAAWSAGL